MQRQIRQILPPKIRQAPWMMGPHIEKLVTEKLARTPALREAIANCLALSADHEAISKIERAALLYGHYSHLKKDYTKREIKAEMSIIKYQIEGVNQLIQRADSTVKKRIYLAYCNNKELSVSEQLRYGKKNIHKDLLNLYRIVNKAAARTEKSKKFTKRADDSEKLRWMIHQIADVLDQINPTNLFLHTTRKDAAKKLINNHEYSPQFFIEKILIALDIAAPPATLAHALRLAAQERREAPDISEDSDASDEAEEYDLDDDEELASRN